MLSDHSNHNARRVFARKLKEFRLQKGLSQEKLAEIAGLHRTYIGSVERSERNISIDNIERLAGALGIQIKELLENE